MTINRKNTEHGLMVMSAKEKDEQGREMHRIRGILKLLDKVAGKASVRSLLWPAAQ